MKRQKHFWRNVILSVAAIIGYYILFQAFYNSMVEGSLFPYQSSKALLHDILFNFTPIMLLSLLIILIVFARPMRHVLRKMTVDALLCGVALIAYNLLFRMVFGPEMPINWAGTAFSVILIFLGVEVVYYVKHFQRQLRETEEQKRLALQYQYDALKAQVNPHFLFNSLNILYSLVKTHSQSSEDFILSLSHMYRYILLKQGQSTVRFDEEMAFLDDYVKILSIRYKNQFEVKTTYEKALTESCQSLLLIPFTMQLLMENVTKHNIISSNHHMQVCIHIDTEGITMSNPIVPRPAESSHFGLHYLTEIYSNHGKKFYTTNDENTFTAHIPFVQNTIINE